VLSGSTGCLPDSCCPDRASRTLQNLAATWMATQNESPYIWRVSRVWQPLLVADSRTAVLYMSAFASLCKRQPTVILRMVCVMTVVYNELVQ